MSTRMRGIYVLAPKGFSVIYGPQQQSQIASLVDMIGPPLDTSDLLADRSILQDVDVIFSGWGGPLLDRDFLNASPRLKAFFYGAGSLSSIITDEVWNRGILVTSAYAANAVAVAEYCLGVILFSLKHGWKLSRLSKEQRQFPPRPPVPGCYGSRVGLVSLGMSARTLRNLLLPFDLDVVAYDPFVSAEEAEALNVRLVSLQELFKESDVVSIHAPSLEETRGLITGAHVASMKEGATLVNTARGEVVRQPELIQVLKKRPDLQAVLDVTDPEPPTSDSELFDLPNVVLTPHIAGSRDRECQRMGQAMVDELRLFLAGKPMRWLISPELAARSSHRPRQNSRSIAVA